MDKPELSTAEIEGLRGRAPFITDWGDSKNPGPAQHAGWVHIANFDVWPPADHITCAEDELLRAKYGAPPRASLEPSPDALEQRAKCLASEEYCDAQFSLPLLPEHGNMWHASDRYDPHQFPHYKIEVVGLYALRAEMPGGL